MLPCAAKATRSASGDHVMAPVWGSGVVSVRTPDPSACMILISAGEASASSDSRSSWNDRNAISVPSGDQFGSVSFADVLVSRRTLEPSAAIMNNSKLPPARSDENTIRPSRSSRGSAARGAGGGDAHDTRSAPSWLPPQAPTKRPPSVIRVIRSAFRRCRRMADRASCRAGRLRPCGRGSVWRCGIGPWPCQAKGAAGGAAAECDSWRPAAGWSVDRRDRGACADAV